MPDHALPEPTTPAESRAHGVAAIGFGVAAVTWAIGYIGRLPALHLAAPLLLALFLACLAAGGVLAGRAAGAGGWRSGLYVGLFVAAIDLLVLGALVTERSPGDAGDTTLVPGAGLWIAGFLAASGFLGALSGALAPAPRSERDAPRNWPATLSCVAVAATLFLIAIGGLVTSYEAGLAVPDWPTSFGSNMFLLPLSRMTGGVYYEHAHRLYGSLVGLITLGLAVEVFDRERRRAPRALAAVAFLLVAAQGGMGGLRVTETSTILRVAHGITAQLFLALLVALAAMLSDGWRRTERTRDAGAAADRAGTRWLVGLLAVQLVLGALVRHVGQHPWVFIHLFVALVVAVTAIYAAQRARALGAEHPVLLSLGQALLGLVLLQFLLGIAAFFATHGKAVRDGAGVLFGTAHQVTGALLFSAGVLLAVWVHRLAGPAVAEDPVAAGGLGP